MVLVSGNFMPVGLVRICLTSSRAFARISLILSKFGVGLTRSDRLGRARPGIVAQDRDRAGQVRTGLCGVWGDVRRLDQLAQGRHPLQGAAPTQRGRGGALHARGRAYPFDILEEAFQAHSQLLEEPGRVGNLDETELESRHHAMPKHAVAQVLGEDGKWSDAVSVVFWGLLRSEINHARCHVR